jgi:hypothetical protein
LIPGQPLANYLTNRNIEALAIIESLAVVITEHLFTKITRQMVRLST